MGRGEVVLAPFPYSDLQGLKRRPAIVVSAAEYGSGDDVILAMVTSSRSRIENPVLGDIMIEEWQSAGLRVPSLARAGRLLVIERRLIGSTLGTLVEADLAQVDDALRDVFGLS